MNIIEGLTEKYGGEYAEEAMTNAHTPFGKYTFQQKHGILSVDGSKITIKRNEMGGVSPDTEPYLIVLHLDKSFDTELTVFPKGFWNRFSDFLYSKRSDFIPRDLGKQFGFTGKEGLLRELVYDKVFVENLLNERIYIRTLKQPVKHIVLTPEYGIQSIEQFEKYVDILKRIENKIRTEDKKQYEYE